MQRLGWSVSLAIAVITHALAAAAGDEPGVASITEATFRAHVAVLASDSYRGRFPGTAGEDSTLGYLEREYRALGLEPVVGGSYRQPVPLVRRTVLPTPSIRLEWLVPPPGTHALHVSAAGDSTGFAPLPTVRWADDVLLSSTLLTERLSVSGAEIVFVGYGITAAERGWDDYAGLDCRGKVVLALGSDPGRAPADSSLFGGRALTHYALAATKQEIAAAHGAVGILIVHDPEIDGYPFDILTAAAGRARYGLDDGPNAAPKPKFSGTLRKDVGLALLRAAGLDSQREIEAAGRRGFRGKALGIGIDLEMRLGIVRGVSYNMLGLLRGRERPDEIVAYSAHWDHLGVGVPVNGDSIYNGAVDNATGTAALLTLANAFRDSGRRPARSVLFWATTCEEQGLLGSYYYADHPVFPLANTVALINMDALFPFGPDEEMVVTGYGQSDLEDLLARAAAPEGRTVIGDEAPETGAFYRSDQYPLAKKGVPAIFAIGEPPKGPARDRFVRYVQSGYHKPSDELTADWDTRGILQDIRCYYRLGRGLADGTAWPNWRPNNEFRALRDAMRHQALTRPR